MRDMGAGEFDLIRTCFADRSRHQNPHTLLGIGDDASLHQLAPGMVWVVSTDSSIESVHWPTDLPLSVAADRAICSALSDLAAMGAEPLCVWQNVMARDANAVRGMADGAVAALERHCVELAGGDTCRSPFNGLSVTVAGQLPEGTAMRRDAAREGDAIWLVGDIGFHSLGLQQWMAGQQQGCFVERFKHIQPRLTEGQRLRELGVRCCIDVSDGLLQDAGHVADASSVHMQIDLHCMPGWAQLCSEVGKDSAVQAIVRGGEDYALLLTAPESMCLPDSFAVKIGLCSKGSGVQLMMGDVMLDMQAISARG